MDTEQSYEWPTETASNAEFLYRTSVTQARKCRLIPTAESSSDQPIQIQIVAWEDNLEVLDSFDPADVIGAELQIDFPQEANFAQAFESKFYASCGTGNTCTKWSLKDDQTDDDDNHHDNDLMDLKQDLDETGVVPNTFPFCDNGESSPLGKGKPVERNNNLFDDATAYLNIYCYPRSSSKSRKRIKYGYRKPLHRKLEVLACEDFANTRACVRAIRKLSKLGQFESVSSQPKRYLVVVNPYSGTGKGKQVYEDTISPMLEQAGVDHDLCLTEYSGHASERMQKISDLCTMISKNSVETVGNLVAMEKERDVSLYDAIIAVGGDGILFEILQGLWKRPDREELLKKLRFGIIGCGTCNGLAKSISHASNEKYNILESMFLICKGMTSPLDLSLYYTQKKSYAGFLAFAWGLIADIDIESEKIRFLGKLRTDVWAVWRIVNLRSYRARFSYLPPSKLHGVEFDNPESLLPPLEKPLPSNWVTIEDSFILFWAAQVSHASWDVHNSPNSKLQDGLFRILVIRKPCSRLKLINMFLKIESGDHINENACEVYDCVAYRLEPLESGSFNDLDGEVIEAGPIQACVLPSVIQFFTGSTE